jgi:cell cycle sensor histidine kinase DivJ
MRLNRGLPLTSLIWIVALLAALGAAFARDIPMMSLLPYAGAALIPPVFSTLLWPFAKREWAQMAVIFSWIALAIVACFAINFVPMAVLFLCAPAAAALFEREKVIEAVVLSAIFATIVFFVGRAGIGPEPIASIEQAQWGQLAGVMATFAFMICAMYFSSSAGERAQLDMAMSDPEGIPDHERATTYPSAVLQLDRDGRLLSASDAARTRFELASDYLGDHNLTTFFENDDASVARLGSAFDTAIEHNRNVMVNVPSPSTWHEETQLDVHFVPRGDGSIFAFVSDSKDNVSRLRELEQLHAEAEKETADKTLFFAGVSHELRTPLNAIIGFSDMMRSRLFGPLPGKYAEYADLIHDSGQHMLDLIGDVLDISKVGAGKYELNYGEFDIADVVRSSIKMVRPSADAAKLELDVEIETGPDLIVEADRRAVRQILLNLLSNAIKFTPQGGRIVVSAKAVQDILNITVEDNGSGMSTEDLARIGTPYAQAANASLINTRGSGLGLSLVKNLVELHKGRFALTSHPGSGTSVNIFLPIRRPSEDDAPIV